MPPTFKYALITIHVTDARPWGFPTELDPTLRYLTGQQEICPTTQQLHWQLYGESRRAQGIRKWKDALHCNWAHIEARKGTQQQAIDYCTKQETRAPDAVPQATGDKDNFDQPAKRNIQDVYSEALAADSYDNALSIVKKDAPRDYVLYQNQIVNTFKHTFQPQYITPEFDWIADKIPEAILREKAIILSGPSGYGKTQYALSHGEHPLLVSHIDELKKLTPLTDLIVFDDMNFKHWPANSCIHLTDLELPRAINVKYGIATIPQHMHRIFTTNLAFADLFSEKALDQEWEAIERRCHIINVSQKLFE